MTSFLGPGCTNFQTLACSRRTSKESGGKGIGKHEERQRKKRKNRKRRKRSQMKKRRGRRECTGPAPGKHGTLME